MFIRKRNTTYKIHTLIVFWSGAKHVGLAVQINFCLAQKFGPDQNILEPVEGRGIKKIGNCYQRIFKSRVSGENLQKKKICKTLYTYNNEIESFTI